jgi:hypothetical protein
MSPDTAWAWPWWSVMVAINAIQVIICLTIFKRATSAAGGFNNILDAYQKRMLLMGLIFTLVAAYRSIFVTYYLTQLAWFDSLANSSLLIRSFAFFAELSFACLFAFTMLRLEKELPAKDHSKTLLKRILSNSPYLLMICIFVAQFFATSGLITKSTTLFAIEETLWTVGFLCILPLAFVQLRRVLNVKDEQQKQQFKMLITSAKVVFAWCVIYCSYGVFFHLPLEFWGENAAKAAEIVQATLPVYNLDMAAISNAFFSITETKEYSDWGFGFLFWHSSYFTVCVWLAIFLMRAPRKIEQV